ncbi:MAG: fibronectin type III domain-containing protein [Chitinophagales bacterium]
MKRNLYPAIQSSVFFACLFLFFHVQVFAGAPLMPANVQLNDINTHSVKVVWNRVDGVTYSVRFRASDEISWTQVDGVTDSYLLLNRLRPKMNYQVQVQAMNSDGQSSWSTAQSFQSKPAPTGPNMLVIYMDDSRYDCYDVTGNHPWLSTPAMTGLQMKA